MKTMAKLMIVYSYFIFGIIVGIWHIYLGALSIFLFVNNEHLISWLIVVFGPFITLPAIITGLKSMRMSALFLFCGATLSLLFMGISEGVRGEHMLYFIFKISTPMYLLAIIGSALSLVTNHKSKSCMSG